MRTTKTKQYQLACTLLSLKPGAISWRRISRAVQKCEGWHNGNITGRVERYIARRYDVAPY